MKLLENSQFEVLSNALSAENVYSQISTRIESYSCKMAGDCKRLYKQMHDDKLGLSPPAFQMLGPSISTNAFTPPSQQHLNSFMHSHSIEDSEQLNIDIISKKTLFYLISTLNASFQPDYDFSNTLSSEFSKEPSVEAVIKNVENFLTTVDVYAKLKQQLWDSIDKEINLNESEFYSYNPDLASDPSAEDGCLWFFNFFFYNKKMKRIVFLSCRCASKSIESNFNNDDEEMYDDVTLNDSSYEEEEASMFYILNSNKALTTNQVALTTVVGLIE